MSLTHCKHCGNVIINGLFCNDECQKLYEKEEVEKYCSKCNRTLGEGEKEYCDVCRYRR